METHFLDWFWVIWLVIPRSNVKSFRRVCQKFPTVQPSPIPYSSPKRCVTSYSSPLNLMLDPFSLAKNTGFTLLPQKPLPIRALLPQSPKIKVGIRIRCPPLYSVGIENHYSEQVWRGNWKRACENFSLFSDANRQRWLQIIRFKNRSIEQFIWNEKFR